MAVGIAQDIARGLEELHNIGVAVRDRMTLVRCPTFSHLKIFPPPHRSQVLDLKPHNVLMTDKVWIRRGRCNVFLACSPAAVSYGIRDLK